MSHSAASEAPAPNPAADLNALVTASWPTQLIYVAAKLGIADLLADGPRSADDLAVATSTHARSLYRVLRALATFGIFAEGEDGRIANTPLSEALRSGVRGSLRAMAIMNGEPFSWGPWGEVLHALRTGESAFERAYGMNFFEYAAKNPEAAAIFDAAMTGNTELTHRIVPAAYDFSGAETIVDVAGGRGALLASVLEANPSARGVLVDQPHVVGAAPDLLRARGVADRCELVAGNFFESVPSGGDVYMLAHILHDWDDERATAILETCRAAMKPGARLLVVEAVIPDGDAPFPGKLLDLQMFTMTPGGRERSERGYRELLARAGFDLVGIVPTGTSMSVLEAVPSGSAVSPTSERARAVTAQEPTPALALLQMSSGLWIAQAVYAAAELGVPDALADGPLAAEDVAQRVGAHADSLFRFMRALASVGLFAQSEDDVFSLTPLGEMLRSGVPGSWRAWARTRGDEWAWKSWGDLLETVRTGETAFDRVFGETPWEYFGRHRDKGQVFDEAMTNFNDSFGAAVAAGYDFSGIRKLMDVAGGHGRLLAEILRATPGLRGEVFDLPAVVEGARKTMADAGLADRCDFSSGSFFEALPTGADAIVMKFIIHDWDDEKSLAILRNCRAALPEGGRLLLVENVITPDEASTLGKLIDIEMLLIPGGMERTESEYRELLARAGFELTRVVPTECPLSVVEARPV